MTLVNRLRSVLEKEGIDPAAFKLDEVQTDVGAGRDAVSELSDPTGENPEGYRRPSQAEASENAAARNEDVGRRDAQSVGSAGSSRSAVSSMRAAESARKAGLLARVQMLKEKQKMEEEELEMKRRKEELELRVEIAEAEARERALAEHLESEEVRLNGSSSHARLVGGASGVDPSSYRGSVAVHTGTTGASGVDLSSYRSNVEVHAGTTGARGVDPTPHTRTAHMRAEICHDSTVSQTDKTIKFRESSGFHHSSQNNDNLNSNVVELVHQQSVCTQAMLTQTQRSLLPKAEIPVFSGDVTKYQSFLRAFDTRIANRAEDDEERLYFLDQYTSGKPKDVVRSCLHMPPGTGYWQARELLNKRYGDEDTISAAFVELDIIMDWTPLKHGDVEGLDKFSLTLMSCKNVMAGTSKGMRETDHPRTMRKVVEKLPFNLQDRWRRVEDTILENQHRRATFDDIV